ncbi:hypothetical protein HMPREF1981_00551 [Bacteroides pyogenes F0041]|uniref:Uncharacterized protein n=1 Tax=Bacteroides pyogenes F0041 TaxID=1321819 RepID=U2CUX0_9BACE|nr:hypothetical protein HMPREF1981_00551 [Bacteroides pyogenes F0041]
MCFCFFLLFDLPDSYILIQIKRGWLRVPLIFFHFFSEEQ